MSGTTSPSGVLSVDKAEGWTSHDVVAVTRKLLGIRKVGHGGTLDPFATGVLPLLVGDATRFASRMREAPKVYDAHVRFGTETATDDREGEPTRESATPLLDPDTLEPALASLRGVIDQIPPAYSALKVGGQRAYARARAGESVSLAARRVQVFRLEPIVIATPDLRLLVVCSSGTYVRAIARDLGRALGSAAHLAGLRRIAVGALDIADSRTIEALRVGGRDAAVAALRRADEALLPLPARFLEASAVTIGGAGESS